MNAYDEIREKAKRALEKAVTVLLAKGVEDPLEAYWLLVKMEKELGYPVTYDFVQEALRLAEAHRRGMMAQQAEAIA